MSSKECRHPTCSGDTCRRVKKQKKFYTLKRSPIRKVSKKRNKILGEKKLQTQKDRDFFLSIWEERPHICYETGQPIYGEPLNIYFHHILEKSDYPQYRYCKWNIVLVTWEVHSKCHNNIDHAPKILAYRNRLKKKLKIS